MATPNHDRSRLIRVQGPALPVVTLVSESDSTASVGKLIRVHGPALPVVKLMAEPVTLTATVLLTLPLAASDDGKRMFQTLRSLIEKVNEMETLFDRAGVCVDGTLSEVRNGEVVMILVPNDPADAIETCKRIADLLFAALRKTAPITVKVVSADQPETPIYELAA